MTKRPPRASRVTPYCPSGPCDCSVCVEREQLHDVAQWSPVMPMRIVAMTLLGAMEAAQAGRLGAFDLMNCFD